MRISDRTVADEYFRVTEAVEATYQKTEPMPADVEGPNMRFPDTALGGPSGWVGHGARLVTSGRLVYLRREA